jgi:hypothetical protein
MLTNFLNFWILARLMQAGFAAVLCLMGLVVGLRIVRRWRPRASSELQLTLERQSELVSTVIQVALLLEVLGLGLSVAVADHLVGSIRGAMCAFGVFGSAKTGFYGLWISFLTAMACSLWVILHRFDLRLESPALIRRKFLALFLVAPFALADFALAIVFAAHLDFTVIASCCSVWVDQTVLTQKASLIMVSPFWAGVVGLSATLAALATSAIASRRPEPMTAWAASAVSAIAPYGALLGVLWVVAPHALATPQHPCPFCLLRIQGGWIGWPLFAAILVGSVAGMGLGVVEMNRRVLPDASSLRAMQKLLGRWSVLGWAGALLCGLFPVARYWLQSGGVSVFGEL